MTATPLAIQNTPDSRSTSHVTSATGALEPTERSRHIDIVRGIAVFGLIWSNLNPGFYNGPLTTADHVARWAGAVFSAGKFFTLFSLLFGVTLAMQIARAEHAWRPFAARWLRRMGVLYLIGWTHALLFWPGDILREYAIAGAVLLLFRRAGNRTVLLAAVICLGLGANRDSLSVVITQLVRGDVAAVKRREAPNAEQLVRRQAAGEATRTGSYLDVVRTRVQVFPREQLRRASPPVGPLNWITPWYLGLFLVGLVLGRQGVVQQPERHRRTVLAIVGVGAAIGLPLNVYLATQPAWLTDNPVYWPLMIAARLSLGLGYLGGLLLLLQRREWLARLGWFAAVGRMGLTNYIAQTAFVTFVEFNYGMGLQLKVASFACLAMAVAFYLVQIAWSNWWVRRFRFGPVEWLWRCLTYGAAQPFRPAPIPVV
jgi:uncharacterized protein